MPSFNKVILVGNPTSDPEIRHTPKGTAVTDLRLAVNHRWFDKTSGQLKEETAFVDVTLWARQAEVACEFLRKGQPVLIGGRLHMDQWHDRNTGQKRSRLRVVGETMQLLGSRTARLVENGATSPSVPEGGDAFHVSQEMCETART